VFFTYPVFGMSPTDDEDVTPTPLGREHAAEYAFGVPLVCAEVFDFHRDGTVLDPRDAIFGDRDTGPGYQAIVFPVFDRDARVFDLGPRTAVTDNRVFEKLI
jgi:hypothetical protein